MRIKFIPNLLLLSSILLSACATSPPQDSDFVVYGEEPEGPGLFSGDAGETVLFGDSGESSANISGESTGIIPATELTPDNKEEFAAFKHWLKARQAQDANYQEFLQWRQFQAYKKWEDSQ